MESNSLWVIAFDKQTGKRANFAVCPKNNARFYEEKYLMEGYNVGVYTSDEVDELIEQEKREGKM